MRFSGKKIFLGGFLAVLLVGIPLTIFLLQQQQDTRSRAEKSTNVSFSPDSSQTTPLQKSVGDVIPLDITINPGKNLVSFVKLEIQYDPEKLATESANAFQANNIVFPSVLEGPIYTPGKITVTLSVGPDPTKAIQTTVKAGTLTLKALSNTPAGTPTVVTYGASTQVLSLGSNDQASENVLSSPIPAYINIGNGSAYPTEGIPTTIPPTGVPYPSSEPTATTAPDVPTTAPIPTEPAPTSGISVTPEPTGSGKDGGPNIAPVCNTLTLDREATGNAPYAITFGANGTDSDGTISKVTFNFGDGQVSDVTQAGGIGTATVNAQVSHTYNNPGTFQASAILTDSGNSVSTADNCTQTITINSASGSGTTTGGTGGGEVIVVQPTVAPTGSTEVAIGVGIVALLLTLGGTLLFFVL